MRTLSTELLRGASLANGKVPVSNAQNSLRKNTRGKDVWMLSLLGLAACGSSSSDDALIPNPTIDPGDPTNETADNLYSTIEITGGDLAQIDFRQFSLDSVVLQGGENETVNLGGLDADGNALAQIIQDDNGEFAVVVSRPAVNRESSSFSANELKLVVTEGTSYIDANGETKTVGDMGLIANDSAFSIKRAEILISQVIPDAVVATAELSTTEYDLNAAFVSAEELTFSVTVNGATVTVTDGILRAEDFPAGEVGAIHTVVVTARNEDGTTTREQTFTVEPTASVANNTIDVSIETITITDGQGKAAVDIELPFSGGDGELTYELSGERADGDNKVAVEAEYLIASGTLYLSSEVNALFTLTASDQDIDTATVVIDYRNASTQLQVANPIDSTALTEVYNANNATISLDVSDVFHIDGVALAPEDIDIILRGPAGATLTGNNLEIDKNQFADGQHSLFLTAYANGQIATHEIVLGITLEVALEGVGALLNQTLGLIDQAVSYNLDDLFTGTGEIAYEVSSAASFQHNEQTKTLVFNKVALGEGTHTATITATDSSGTKITENLMITIEKNAEPMAKSDIAMDLAGVGGNVTVDVADQFDLAFGNGIITYAVDNIVGYNLVDTEQRIEFRIDETSLNFTNGLLEIKVTATDADNEKDIATITLHEDAAPTLAVGAAVATQDLAANANLDLAVNVASLFDHVGGATLTYAVSAGAITGSNQTIAINANDLVVGTNTIKVTATDADGGTDADSVAIEFVVNVADSEVVVGAALGNQNARDFNHAITYDISSVFAAGNFTNNHDGSLSTYAYTSTSSFVSFSGDELIVDTNAIVHGTHTINVTATDKDGDTATSQFALVLGEAIDTQALAANTDLDLAVDVAAMFAHLQGPLTYAVSAGAITGNDQTISINANDLVVGENIIAVSATRDFGLPVTLEFAVNVADSLVVVGTAITAQFQRDTDQMYAIDLSNVFSGGNHTNNHDANLSTYNYTSSNTFVSFIGDELIFDTNQLGLGTHIISVTATDKDGDTVSSQFNLTLIANSVPVVDNNTPIFVHGAKQHLTQTIDVSDVFTGGDSTAVSIKNPISGIALANGILTITNANPPEGDNLITLEAEDADGETAEFVVTYSLRTIKDGAFPNEDTHGHGTTLADQVTSNTIENQSRIRNATFSAYEGDDNISTNSFDSGTDVIESFTLDGGEGDDTIGSNSLIAANASQISLLGQAGADSITANNISATLSVFMLTIDGGTENDTITINEFSGKSISSASILGGKGEDTIMSNKFTATGDLTIIDLDGGDGNDAISGNQLTANRVLELELIGAGGADSITSNTITTTLEISTLTIDGGTENDTITGNKAFGIGIAHANIFGGTGEDTITSNSLTVTQDLSAIMFDGGADNDTIESNILNATGGTNISFLGKAGTDSIANNSVTATNDLSTIAFDGGAGDDTISGNQLSAGRFFTVALRGADGEDSITSNTFNTSTTSETSNITIDGGIGDDTISGNTFTATNGAKSVLHLFGGAGNDTFANNTATSAGSVVSAITVDGGTGSDVLAIGVAANTDHTLDITAVTGFDFTIENAATIWNISNVEKVQVAAAFDFSFAGGTGDDNLTASTTSGAGSSPLAIAVDGGDGTDSLILGSSPTISYTFDLMSQFDLAATSGNTEWNLSNVEHVQVDATFAFNLAGGTGEDTITSNTISSSGPNPTSNITIDGGGGNDTFSRNAFTSATGATSGILLLGGAGDDTFEDNTATSAGALVSTITVDGGADSDTLTLGDAANIAYNLDLTTATGFDLTATSTNTIWNIRNVETVRIDDSFDFSVKGGDGNDTLSDSTISSTGSTLSNITIDGGLGNDMFSGNVFTSAIGATSGILLFGGDGDDTFANNTATSAGSLSSTITIDGGIGADTLTLGSSAIVYTFLLAGTGFDLGAKSIDTIWNIRNVETVKIDNQYSEFYLTGGTGDDTLTASFTTTSSYLYISIDGGDGEDTLTLGAAASIAHTLDITTGTGFNLATQSGSTHWGIKNVETVQTDAALALSLTGGDEDDTLAVDSAITAGSSALTIAVDGRGGDDDLTLGDSTNIASTLDITGGTLFNLAATTSSGDKTWNINRFENVQADATFSFNFTGTAHNDSLSVGGTASSPAQTITVDGGGGTDTLTLDGDKNDYNFENGGVQLNFTTTKDNISWSVTNVEKLYFVDSGEYTEFGSSGIAPEPPQPEPRYGLEPYDPEEENVPPDPYG